MEPKKDIAQTIPEDILKAQRTIEEAKKMYLACKAGLDNLEKDTSKIQDNIKTLNASLAEAISDRYSGMQTGQQTVQEVQNHLVEAKAELEGLDLAKDTLERRTAKFHAQSVQSPEHIKIKSWKARGCPAA